MKTNFFAGYLCVVALLTACASTPGLPTQITAVPATAAPATSVPPTALPIPPVVARAAIEKTPIEKGPTLLFAGIGLRKVLDVGGGTLRLAYSASENLLYFLTAANEIHAVKLDGSNERSKLFTTAQLGIVQGGTVSGMRFGPDGALYVVYNSKPGPDTTRAVVLRGTPDGAGGRKWSTAVRTAPYPASNTNFDHLFNGIVITPDNKFIFLNAGSRTDHGEIEDAGGAHPNVREVALTTKVFRVPVQVDTIELPNDDATLRAKGYVFADGTRNVYDMAFAPNGDLFGIDNGPDADYPDEINWLREGRHYGFPWKFGAEDNPQQFGDYDPAKDNRLSKEFVAVQRKTYTNDPAFPKAPANLEPPLRNLGPAAIQYRAADGSAKNAATDGTPFYGVTAHRSQLGLAFVTDTAMPADLRSTATEFSLLSVSWGAAGGPLSDKGQDLIQFKLVKSGDSYEMRALQLARGFRNPIDSVLVKNKLYVLEFGGSGSIWELSFE